MSRLPLLIVLLTCLLVLPVHAQTTPPPTATAIGNYVVARDIYVRGGPNETYLPVGRLILGVAVTPVNISADGNWVLIRYSRGFGWIRRDLAEWSDDIDALPTLDETNLTPTSFASDTATPRPTGVLVEAGEAGAYVRFGPGTNFPYLGAVVTGDTVEPVGRSVDGNWILIRFRDGFGWVSRSLLARTLVLGELPVLLPDALTPSATLLASLTPLSSDTPTLTITPSPSLTESPTLTASLIPTNTAINTATSTETTAPSATPTLIPTNTRTDTQSPTNTASLTLTLTPSVTDTLTPTFTATDTPSSTPTNTATATDTASPTPSDTATRTATDTSTLTATDTRTNTATNTRTPTATLTETSTPAINIVLAQVTLSRTITPRPSRTSTLTATSTATDSPTSTATSTATNSATNTLTHTPTDEPTDTPTDTHTPRPTTSVPTEAATDTRTPRPTATIPTETPTEAVTDTRTPRPTATIPTEVPTDTRTPRAAANVSTETTMPGTATSRPSATTTELPSETPSEMSSVTPSEEASETLSATPSQTASPSATQTPSSSATSTATRTASPTSVPTETRTPAAAIILPTPVSSLPETVQPSAPTIPPEAIVGGVLLVLLIGYVGLYWRGLATADRYSQGFVIERCPVCKQGHLSVEIRQGRVLGIPRPRATVRCDTCRSVLREVGNNRWRYAVDPSENPPIYNRFNGRVVDEDDLMALELQSPSDLPPVHPPAKPPTFVDDEE